MKPHLPAKDMMARTIEVREAYAREVLDIGAVGMMIKERVAAGADWLHVRQKRPMRLQSTRAAHRLIAWLAREGYRIDWREVVPSDGDHETAQYAELRIFWSDRLQAVTVPAAKWIADNGYVATDAGSTVLPGAQRRD